MGKISLLGRLLYRLAHFVLRNYFFLIRRWQVEGRENVPEKGPLIIVANHISAWDPPVLGCAIPTIRQVQFMAKEELFKNPIVAWVFKTIGTFPVKRNRGDRRALKNAMDILDNGGTLGLFPEGTRNESGNLGEAKPGAVLIACRTEAPILPVALKNTGSGSDHHPIKVVIGKPFKLDQYYSRRLSREEMEEAGNQIMSEIRKMLSSGD